MPILSPVEVIQISLGVFFGSFGLFKVLFERDFRKRFIRFKGDFESWLNKQILAFLSQLQDKISRRKVTPSEVISEIQAWAEKQASLAEVTEEYQALDETSNNIVLTLGVAIIFAVLGLLYPLRINPVSADPTQDRPFFWVDVGTAALFLGIYLVFRYVLRYLALSRRMTKVEEKTPFEKIFEQELSEAKE